MKACSTQFQLQAVGPAFGPVSLNVLSPWGPPIGPLLVPELPAPLLRVLSTFVMFDCVVLLGSHPNLVFVFVLLLVALLTTPPPNPKLCTVAQLPC